MNKVMLIGNVGQEPEVRYVDQGVAVARIRLATTERGYTLQNGTDKQGQRRYATEIWADNVELLSPKPAAAGAVNEPLAAPQPDTKPDEGLPF